MLRLAGVGSALDLDSGGGEVLGEATKCPAIMCAADAWPPKAIKAREHRGPRAVKVVELAADASLPFADAFFDLVTFRHPVRPADPCATAPDTAAVHRL